MYMETGQVLGDRSECVVEAFDACERIDDREGMQYI